ncbi:MAG: glycosyltransferase [Deltaproteobacteria bacterium]|nr:glycosyltransferase [Deltaproteobacteria bacterium]
MIWFGFTALVFFIIGFFILYRVPVCDSNKKPPRSLLKISIIIPARNEEHNLPKLLSSLKNQTLLPDEVIVVDDNSEDATARVAGEYQVRVITSSALPEGWLGKPWSCHQGAQKATGNVFIFLDADTFLETSGLERMMRTFIAGPGVVSVFPYHQVEKFHEAFSVFFNLMQLIGMNAFSFLKSRKPTGMFGPCLIISRNDYVISGGHEAVREEVLEHYTLAGVLEKHGIAIRLFSGKGSLNVRMYPEGWKTLIQGWTKSFTAGAGKTPPLTMRLSIMWISGLLITPVFFLVSIFSGPVSGLLFWSAIYTLYVLQLYIQFRRTGTFPLWSMVFYPINLAFFLTVFTWAGYRTSRNKQISWKGRKINQN